MIYSVPSREHPIYVEWRRWRHECDKNYSEAAAHAKASIERIAEHAYDYPTIVGYMIMMDDTQSEEEEMAAKQVCTCSLAAAGHDKHCAMRTHEDRTDG